MRSDWRQPFREIPVGRGRWLRDGTDVAVLSLGHVGNTVAEAVERASADGVSAAHIDLRFAKPLDATCLHEVGRRFGRIVVVEDGTVTGESDRPCWNL